MQTTIERLRSAWFMWTAYAVFTAVIGIGNIIVSPPAKTYTQESGQLVVTTPGRPLDLAATVLGVSAAVLGVVLVVATAAVLVNSALRRASDA